jgi:hypothetical protein
MAQLTFSQAERRNFAGPILIAVAVLAAAAAAVYVYLPRRVADLSVTHTAILPTHTVIATESKLVGHQAEAEDAFYVLPTIRIDDKLHVPLFLSDITGTLTTADDSVVTVSAVHKADLDNVTTTFPALKPLLGPPLLRESSVPPSGSAEGTVLLSFPITQADWENRKSATVTVVFYHQGSFTVTIPNPLDKTLQPQ